MGESVSAEAEAIERLVSGALGVDLAVVVAREPALDQELSDGERDRLAGFATHARQDEWRLGRAALKGALRAIGETPDTAGIELPHRRLSLTHSGGVAIATATRDARAGRIGVDLEVDRAPRMAMARFFLQPSEQAWLCALPEGERARALLRLWTIKEAVFKADRDNASATLRDYRLDSPGESPGEAVRGEARFAYVDTTWERGSLAVAVQGDGR
jgi:4'-phosphopantetheinyl transferase EntD